ncbi:translocation/assembly module TamB domain-containing protein [Roseateles sp. DB2]|uniref:translocation/assembly module TamB domain-containing protein n=1 Tax=Roseateles sp. DB2 TaxID=3453717 RepID=UPI003EEAF759
MSDDNKNAAPSPAPQPPRRRLGRWLAWGLVLPGLLGATALGGVWLMGTEAGTAWLLRQAPALISADAPQGRLLGDFSARQLRLHLPGGTDLQFDGLRWQGLRLGWHESPQFWARLDADSLRADRLEVRWKPSDQPSAPLTDLRLPLSVQVNQLAVGQLDLPTAKVQLTQLEASVKLGQLDGRQQQSHEIQLHSLRWQAVQLKGGMRAQADGPMALQAHLEASGQLPQGRAWQARLQAQGPLLDHALSLDFEAAGQSVALQARARPMADWPLAGLQATLKQFDLAALNPEWPRTALSGQLSLEAQQWERPADLKGLITNALGGPWDQQRLPVARLQADLQFAPAHWQSLLVRKLELGLVDAKGEAAGSLQAQGQLSPDQASDLQLRLNGLRLDALHSQLLALALDGQLRLRRDAPPAQRPSQAPAQKSAPTAPLPWLDLEGQLSTRLASAGVKPLSTPQLQLKAQLSEQGLRLHRAELSAGKASASVQGEWIRQQQGDWQARLQAQSQQLDPSMLWKPAASGSAPHSLNLQLAAQLHRSAGSPWPQGEASLRLLPSQWAGQPLQGRIQYLRDEQPARVLLSLEQERNQLQGEIQGLEARRPEARLQLQWPRLAALDPLLAALAPGVTLEGGLQGELALRGQTVAATSARSRSPSQSPSHWTWTSQGQLTLQQLVVRQPDRLLRLDQGKLNWQLGTALADALVVSLDAGPLRFIQARRSLQLEGLQGRLSGSWAHHQLQLQGQGRPLGLVAGEPPLPGAALLLALDGQLNALPWGLSGVPEPLDWRLSLQQARLRPVPTTSQDPWVQIEPLQARLSLSPEAQLISAELQEGRASLAGGQARLHWKEVRYQAPQNSGAPPVLQVDAQLEPLALAPLLAKAQPDFGWGGDLLVDGHLRLDTRQGTKLSFELQRLDGDLSVTEDRGVQRLGLTDFGLRLQANQGLWSLTQALAGSNLGGLGGSVVTRTDPRALMPPLDTPLEGTVQANVANLATWGGWIPAGWRVSGAMTAGFMLGGTLGDPQLRGLAQGEGLALRNPLLGVDVRDTRFQLSLEGTHARLQQFSARAAEGELKLSGEARLGAQPDLQLDLQAEKFGLLTRLDRRIIASGQGKLHLTPASVDVQGAFRVDEGLFDFSKGDAPTLDEDVRVRRPVVASTAVRRDSPPMKVAVQLDLDLGEQMKLRGRGLDTRLTGQLKLQHKEGKPSLVGTVRTEGGTYDAYGQKLTVEKGEILFTGVLDNPRLDVLAVRPNTDIRVGVTVGGTAINPRIKLFSEPELPETDKLSWLLLGRGPDELGRADTALLQRAALALLSGEGESASGRLMKNLGLDELSVSQGAQDDTRGAIVRVGKQLSKRVYVGYERGLNATTGSWQLIYRVAQRFTLRAQSGEDSALDLIWQWRWQ